MPRVVDPTTRRQELAEAVWRVIRRDGVERASVREVAREAGLSTGSLRHYFATQSELLAFAMQLVTERVQARVAALDLPADRRLRAEAVLAELLPLDDERRAEMAVWLAFLGQSLVDPALRQLRAESDAQLLAACRYLVAELGAAGEVASGLDVDFEAERLNVVLDGVALHAVSRPQQVTPEVMRAVVAAQLDSLRPR